MLRNISIAVLLLLLVLVGYFAFGDWQASHGDLNHDGKVNAQDVSILSTHFKQNY